MIDWSKGGRTTKFRYVRVSWPDMSEIGSVEGVTGCEIEENALSSLKVTGSLDYSGIDDLGDDLVRVYSDSALGEDSETVCHATLFLSTPSSTVAPSAVSGTGDMYSTLIVLKDDAPENTFTAGAGVNPVAVAKRIAETHSLSVVATPSSYVLAASRSYDEDFTYLDIVNDLLEVAGYGSADVDAYGNVIMAPYVDPSSKDTAVVFSDTDDDVSGVEFAHEIDKYSVPNVVKLVCSNAEEAPMVSIATNDDPENPYSTVARRRRIVRTETISDIDGKKALDAKARELLISSMLVVEKIEIPHAWKRFQIGDAVWLDYEKSGMSMKLTVVKRVARMTPDIDCTTTARRFVNLMEVKE